MPLRQLELATSWGPLKVAGGSRAGEATLVVLPQLRLVLDPGRPHRAIPRCRTAFVSHGHLDHLGGLAYWASQRQLHHLGEATALVPRELTGRVEELLGVHARLEGGRPYPVTVRGLTEGDRFPLRRDLELEPFRTHHWVPTLGVTLVWTRRRLRPDLVDRPAHQLAALRRRGESVETVERLRLLTYTADTGPDLFERRPELLASEVLLLECTFFRASDRHRAARFGHLHLEDLETLAPRLACRHLVLLHPSRRHTLPDALERLQRIPFPAEVRRHHLMVEWE